MPKPSKHDLGVATLRGGATRAAILEQAATLFATKGFDGTALQDIADAMGLTRPALYHYFTSKEDVLASLIAQTSQTTSETLRAIRDRKDLSPSSKIRGMTTELLKERTSSPEQFRLIDRSESSLPDEMARAHRAARRAILADIVSVVAEGIDAGEFRNTNERLAALAVLGICNWVAWWYVPGKAEQAEEVIASLGDSAVAMLVRPTDHATPQPGSSGALAMLRSDLTRLVDDVSYLERVIPAP
jgi:AcrR family transcriptional regulator